MTLLILLYELFILNECIYYFVLIYVFDFFYFEIPTNLPPNTENNLTWIDLFVCPYLLIHLQIRYMWYFKLEKYKYFVGFAVFKLGNLLIQQFEFDIFKCHVNLMFGLKYLEICFQVYNVKIFYCWLVPKSSM